MDKPSQTGALQYLRLFSYLLIICDAFGVAMGGAVLWVSFSDMGNPESFSVASLTLGICALAVNGLTVATGIVGRLASRNADRLGQLRTVTLAGIVAAALSLGLCYMVGAGLPTSLIFSLLLLAISVAIAGNLAKSSQ